MMEGETDRGKDGVYMENGWMKQVADKLKRQNQILFSRDSACLQELLELIRQQPHRVLVDWAFTCVERPLEILEAHLPREDRPRTAVETCRRWAAGEVKMPQAKRALLQAHQAAGFAGGYCPVPRGGAGLRCRSCGDPRHRPAHL